jgi:hypothetical protein
MPWHSTAACSWNVGPHAARTTIPISAIDSHQRSGQRGENRARTWIIDRFRDQLLFSIGFVIERNRPLLRRILKEHVSDDEREQLAKRVVEHLERSGFEIDEEQQIMRRRPPTHGHG